MFTKKIFAFTILSVNGLLWCVHANGVFTLGETENLVETDSYTSGIGFSGNAWKWLHWTWTDKMVYLCSVV